MTIADMHYDFKLKVNKVDSQKFRNLKIPEIDWKLREAEKIFVKSIAEPRYKNHLGFEINQRVIDDIRTLVKSEEIIPEDNIIILPNDYMFYIRGRVSMSKGKCEDKKGVLKIQKHDDEFEESILHCSSFDWRTVNGIFNQEGIKLFNKDFSVDKVFLTYIKQLPITNFSEGFVNGSYKLPSGILLNKNQDSILPEHTHQEIVDIAVQLAIQDMMGGQSNINSDKLKFNQLI